MTIKERKKEFESKIRIAILGKADKYQNKKFLNKFYSHWTEHDDDVKANTLLRWEYKKHQPFNTFRRMVKFYSLFGTDQWDDTKKVYHKPVRQREEYTIPKVDYTKYQPK